MHFLFAQEGGLTGEQWFVHAHRIAQELHELKQSWSWKVSAPFRWIVQVGMVAKELWRMLQDSLRHESLGTTLQRMTDYAMHPQKFKELAEPPELRALIPMTPPALIEPESASEVAERMQEIDFLPLISVIIPVYNTSAVWLEECFQSVMDQTYPNWEICAYDDASTNQETLDTLQQWKGKDSRVRITYGKENVHISEACNAAVETSNGELVALLDHDDTLATNALWEVVKCWNEAPKTDFVYSDEDKLDEQGRYVEPYFKSDFNLDLLRSNNYINHLSVFTRRLFEEVGGFRKGFEGSQDHDLFLRMAEATSNFEHIPKVLYHWRKVPGSTAAVYAAKSYPEKAAIKALEEHLERIGAKGSVERGLFPGSFRLKREITTNGLVSIIIPFRDEVELLKTCIESIRATVEYPRVEIVLVDNNSEKQETFDYLNTLDSSIQQVNYPGAFNFSAINNFAAKQTKGDYILFLNNDIEARKTGWLEAMIEHIQREEVGAVGAKLLYPDKSIQHAGVILGIGGIAGHSHKYLPGNQPGYFMRASVIQNLSACTAACLMVKRSVLEEVKGFDEEYLKVAFNDVDLCLKVRRAGYLIVYTPYAELIHHESKSRGAENTSKKIERFNKETELMNERWGGTLARDPYYNPNLSVTHEDFRLKQQSAWKN